MLPNLHQYSHDRMSRLLLNCCLYCFFSLGTAVKFEKKKKNYWEIWKIYATDVILEVTMDQCSTVLSLVNQSRKLNLIGAMCIKVAGYTEPKQIINNIYTFPEPQPLQPQSNGGDHRTRSHNHKLVVPFARTNSYQFFFLLPRPPTLEWAFIWDCSKHQCWTI